MRWIYGVIGLALVALANAAAAGPIAVTFTGTVTSVYDTTDGRVLAGMGVGSAFSVTVTYDSLDGPIWAGDRLADYRFGVPSMTLGGTSFAPVALDDPAIGALTVIDDYDGEDVLLVLAGLNDPRYDPLSYFNITATDTSGSVFSDTRLPTSLDGGGFTWAAFGVNLRPLPEPDLPLQWVSGRIDSITVTAVPEPAGLALLLSAGAGLVFLRRRRPT